MSSKITAEKLIEDRRGIDALLKEIEKLKFEGPDELSIFRNIMGMYKVWASSLSNDNILDVARSIESALSSEPARQHLLQYRVDHLRRLGVFEISEEELRRQKAERNLQRALAKRQQMEQQRDADLLKEAQKSGSHNNSEDQISEADNEGSEYDSE